MSKAISAEPVSFHVVMSGTRVPFTVRKNIRARRVWIKMEDHSGLVLVLPRWASPSKASEFMKLHQDWVLKRWNEREERLAKASPPMGTGRTVVYRGRPLSIRVRNCACAAPTVEWHRDHLLVQVPHHEESPLSEILETSFREKAKEIFTRRVESLSGHLELYPKAIQVRDQKTRWGACTGRGTLTFNWRLILAPPPVLDYVVIHELCHLRHANHGRRFWELVGSVCPSFAAHKAWLRENGAFLRSAT